VEPEVSPLELVLEATIRADLHIEPAGISLGAIPCSAETGFSFQVENCTELEWSSVVIATPPEWDHLFGQFRLTSVAPRADGARQVWHVEGTLRPRPEDLRSNVNIGLRVCSLGGKDECGGMVLAFGPEEALVAIPARVMIGAIPSGGTIDRRVTIVAGTEEIAASIQRSDSIRCSEHVEARLIGRQGRSLEVQLRISALDIDAGSSLSDYFAIIRPPSNDELIRVPIVYRVGSAQ